MFKLKGKMMWLFALFSVGLLAIGIYFYDSLNALGTKVENTLSPNKRSDHLKKIMVDLNKLNNLYLIDSERFSSMKSNSLISTIEKNVDSVKNNFNQDRILENRNLDTIPKLLRQIRDDYFELEKRKEESQEVFIDDLKLLVDAELSKIEAKPSDSVTIIKQINSEIYEKVEPNSEEVDERNFFQKLFGASKPEESPEAQVVSSRDTLVNQSIDTLFTKNQTSESKFDITPAIKAYQNRRSGVLNSLKQQEQAIFRKNIEVNNYVENTLNEILFEEYEYYENSIRDLRKDSLTYFYELGIIIAFLVLISLITLFIILNDINKNIYYQQRLKANEEEAKRNALEKQKFLSTMSHELRTPLTSIIGYSDLLDDTDENVKSIKSASNYLYQMTNEILDMAKIQAGIIDIHVKPCDLSTVFIDIKQSFYELIKNQNIEPIFNIPKDHLLVKADAHRIQQILYNLMHNALKYTDEGFIKLDVQPDRSESTTSLSISIEDSGVGMTTQEIKSIFKDYHQAGTHKNKMKGTGLGLGIVKKLVNDMGGKLSVTSEEGKGTSFQIDFEFETVENTSLLPTQTKIGLPSEALKDKRIFILDDDKLIARLHEKLFTPYQANLQVFTDAKEAFQHLLEFHDYDLYLIDFKMPFMTGYELITELKSKGIVLENTLVITANVMLDDEDKEKLNVFDDIVFKPIKKENIIEKIVHLLNLNGELKSVDFTPETEERDLYNFKDLKVYAGDDEGLLKELVETLVEENEKELHHYKKALETNDNKHLAEIIHKLSSRFSQVNVTPIKDPKSLEMALDENSNGAYHEPAMELYQHWKMVNDEMKKWL